jgi:mitochondrial import inner membrane translocase subunit TIM44
MGLCPWPQRPGHQRVRYAVVQAYLEGSQEVLKEYCSPSMLERFIGIHRVTMAEGHIPDSTILDFSEVDMVDMKMLDNDPVIILHFSCQQINCVRDQYGNVVSGSPDDVNRVYYYWAVQQDGVGMVTTSGEYLPPRWQLTEMLLRGMHQLL